MSTRSAKKSAKKGWDSSYLFPPFDVAAAGQHIAENFLNGNISTATTHLHQLEKKRIPAVTLAAYLALPERERRSFLEVLGRCAL